MNTNRIAVGVDFSSEADRAVLEAREIARLLDEELVLVHAASRDDVEGYLAVTGASRDGLHRPGEEVLDRARVRLGDMRERFASEGVKIRQALIEGHADSALGVAAREVGAEMIVVGTHGYAGLGWLLLGSVSERVIRAADVDVLVARDPEPPRGGYRRILVATDFSPSAARAYERALALAAPNAEIQVVHFFNGKPDPAIDEAAARIGVQLEPERLERILAAGQSFLGESRRGDRQVRLYVVDNAAIPGILLWLESEPFDLVALGSHGRHGLRRFLLGSVSETIARRAPCSVLVARGHESAE